MNEHILEQRADKAVSFLWKCSACPRDCRVNRLKGERGYCGMGRELMISSYGPHFGEEDVLVGRHGSGTIFLTGCNLGCIFCQNYDISRLRNGYEVSKEEFSDIVLTLQKRGCHNINFVTPTHFTPQILEALALAKDKGLKLALVYNCGGYESVETLKLLDGIIDIYMPDIKFMDSGVAKRLCNAPDYPDSVKKALIEMHRQVGDLIIDNSGIAKKGLLVRHLVLPNGLASTKEAMRFIATKISKNTYVNIMDQYRPMYKAKDLPELNRLITREEYDEAIEIANNFSIRLHSRV